MASSGLWSECQEVLVGECHSSLWSPRHDVHLLLLQRFTVQLFQFTRALGV